MFIHVSEEADLRVHVVSSFSESSEVRSRQASVLAVYSSCGNKRGTSKSKEF